MRFVDDEPREGQPFDHRRKAWRREALRRDVEQAQATGPRRLEHAAALIVRLGGVERAGSDATPPQVVHLILHERNERRNHQGQSVHAHGRRLKAERLPAAGGQHHDRIAVREYALHRLALQRQKRVEAPIALEHAEQAVENSLRLLGMEALVVATGPSGRFTGAALERSLAGSGRAGELAAVIASAGSTNAGVVDELGALARVAHHHDAWLHVDGAYGAGALLLPERRHLFDGLGEADSLIVDPHKWFFCTAATCALLYRNPASAARTHTQHGPYIDVLHSTSASEAWNPSDYAFQLTRRASGLPFWFTLLVHGTDAMAEAIRSSIATTSYAVERLREIDGVELVMEPELTVILFRKAGWDAGRFQAWARDLLAREVAFVAPTRWKGETVGRLVFLHPLTTESIVDEVLATLR